MPGFNMDTYKVSYHGYSHSHMDALCHILYKEQTYNGYARAVVNTEKGCTKLGIDNLKQGLITRAVLLDIPRLKNVPYLEPGTAIYQEDVEAWEKMAGVKIQSGDVILLAHRTLGAPREGRTVECRPQRRRLPRLDHSVHQGARRGDRRQRRRVRSDAVDGRRAWHCRCTRC